jgi:hypothetical protein
LERGTTRAGVDNCDLGTSVKRFVSARLRAVNRKCRLRYS